MTSAGPARSPDTERGRGGRPAVLNVRRIVVIRRHNHLGDMLCSLPLYAALRQRYPAVSLTLAAAPTAYEIELRRVNPFLDEVLVYPRSGPGATMRFCRRLRAGRFDMAIVPATVKMSRSCDLMAYLSGARLRVGVASVGGVKNPTRFLLNRRTDFDWRHRHQAERHLDVARLAGCEPQPAGLPPVPLVIGLDRVAEVAEWLAPARQQRRPVVAVHPGAGQDRQKWPVERFHELAARLDAEANCSIVFTGGPVESAAPLGVAVPSSLVAIPRIGLSELAAVLRLADLVVTGNTGPMHLAHAVGARMVALSPRSLVDEWCYQSDRERVVPAERIEDISVGEVADACLSLLQQVAGSE